MKKIALAAAAAVIAASSAFAAEASVVVNFSFTNTMGSVPGTVTGHILGLSDNATGAATDVIIDSVPAGLVNAGFSNDVFQWANLNIAENSFTIENGVVTGASFVALSGGYAAQLYVNGYNTNFLNMDTVDQSYVYANYGIANSHLTVSAAAAVPEVATWGMMVAGFGLIGATMRRKKPAVSFA